MDGSARTRRTARRCALQGRILVCPFHALWIDCVTGLSDADDSLRQATYAVKTENGEIFADLP